MKTRIKVLLIAALMVLFVGTIQAQVDFTGTWAFKYAIPEDSTIKKSNEDDLVIVKVTDEYYRSTMGNTNLLFKLVKPDSLFSNFSPDKVVTIAYKTDNTLRVTVVYNEDHTGHNHGPGQQHDHPPKQTLIWERKKG